MIFQYIDWSHPGTWVFIAVWSYVFVTGWFFAISYARMLQDKDVTFTWHIKAPLYFYLAVGAVADFIFNVLVATVIFVELPRELLFTDRVKRHVTKGNKRQYRFKLAQYFKRTLNKIDPGHV